MVKLIILFSLIGGVLSTIGGALLLFKKELAKSISLHLISFAAGTLLGVVFLDLLPEAIELVGEKNGPIDLLLLLVLLGFVFFFLLEGFVFRLHSHEYESNPNKKTTTTPWLLVAGDAVHNFLDGIAIAAAFLVSIPLGITTSLAVAAHEVPQEIGDVSVMIYSGWKRKKILFLNTMAALTTTLGAILAYSAKSILEPVTGYIAAITAGLFIYIAASDLIPELHEALRKDKMTHVLTLFILGITTIAVLARLLKA